MPLTTDVSLAWQKPVLAPALCWRLPHTPAVLSPISSSPTAGTPCGQPPARACVRQTPSQASWTWLPGRLRWGREAVTAVLLWCGIPGQRRRAGVPVLARLSQFPGCASDLSWILGSRPVLPLLFIHPCSVFIVLNAPVGHQHLYTRDVLLSHGQAGRRGISDLKRKAQTTVKCDS